MLQYDGAPAVMAALADITEQRRLTEALRDSEARLAAFMDHAPVGMYVKDLEGRYVMANPEMAKVFGRPVEEVLGRTPAGVVAPDDVAAIAAYDAEVLRTGRVMVHQEHLAGLDDYEWSLVIRFPIQDEQGQIINIAGFDVDISGQKRIEQQLVQQQEAVHQSEKLAALGSLLTGIAHELNNPLSIVAGYATMLRDFSRDEGAREKAEGIHIAAEQCAKIVRSFLAIARSQPRELELVDINASLEAALAMLGYGLCSADVTLEPELPVSLPPVFGDADRLHQVFANLIVDAQQAMQQSNPPRRLRLRTFADRNQVVVEVADTGPGIPNAIRSQIFDPFFTTKPTGVGTGVGLSVSHGIVVAHGGTIEALPDGGGGAVFRFALPAAGHEVEFASSGREGLALLAQRGFDLIISDLRMPDMDGPSLYRHLRQHRPELTRRLVFITGDVLGTDMSGAIAEDRIPILEKPIDLAAVIARIGLILGDGEQS